MNEYKTIWTGSSELGELFGALSQAQAQMVGAKKGAANSFFKSKYADLSEVRKVASTIHEFGLCITQLPTGENGLTTILGHKSGQYIESLMTVKPTKNDPQGTGSALTYMRRYAMQAVLGIPSEDDDGNEAIVRHKEYTEDQKYAIHKEYTEEQKYAILNTLTMKKAKHELENFPSGDPMKTWSEQDWNRAGSIARKYLN